MPIKLPPGDYRISVYDPADTELHYVSVNAVFTKDPTERILAAARGACGYARDQGNEVEKFVVYDKGRQEVVLTQQV